MVLVWPPAGRRGTTVQAHLAADFVDPSAPLLVSGSGVTAKVLAREDGQPSRYDLAIEIAADANPGQYFLSVPDPSGSLSPLSFLVFDEQLSREKEPNGTLESSPPIPIPSLLLGKIDEPGDVDSFAFQANEGDALVFQIDARKAGSDMFDPHLAVLSADGDIISLNDDAPSFQNPRNRDPKLEINIPFAPNCAKRSDRFFVQVRDTSKHSGGGLFYLLRVRKQVPDFELAVSSDRISLERGGTASVPLKLRRTEGFVDDVDVVVDGLPPGVSAKPLIIRSTQSSASLELAATESATPGAAVIGIHGMGKRADKEFSRNAIIPESTLGDGFSYAQKPLETLQLAVVTPVQYALDRVHPDGKAARTLLSLSGTRQSSIIVKLQRRGGFEAPLDFSFEGLPKGIALEKVQWSDEGRLAELTLLAERSADLRLGEYRIAVVAAAQGAREATESFFLRLDP